MQTDDHSCFSAPSVSPSSSTLPVCSIIIPVHNAANYLSSCLSSLLSIQSPPLHTLEVLLYDDHSTDNPLESLSSLLPVLHESFSRFLFIPPTQPRLGVGGARNLLIKHSTSSILIFLDADDLIRPTRISRSLHALTSTAQPRIDIVGGIFDRIPHGSTPRYEEYHRRLRTCDLFTYAFRDAPLAMPTVACWKDVWERVGGFVEGTGVAEDLWFEYAVLREGMRMEKLQGESLTGYRFHQGMTSLSLSRRMLLKVRVGAFEELVVQRKWGGGRFSIWGAGRDGKEVFKNMGESCRKLVTCWGDVSDRKIGGMLYGIPVVHFSKLQPPVALCVALDREGREFESNVASMNWRAGEDYVHLV